MHSKTDPSFNQSSLLRFILYSIIFCLVIFLIIFVLSVSFYYKTFNQDIIGIFQLPKELVNSLLISIVSSSIVSVSIIFFYGKKYLIKHHEKLARVESRLELALEASNIGTWYWDLNTNEVLWDEHIYQVFGASKEDFNNDYLSFEKFILEEDRQGLKDEIQKCLKQNTYLNTEFRIKKKDSGVLRYIAVKARVLLNVDGSPKAMTGINLDISQEKATQALIAQKNEELERSNKALQEFAYFVSHDLQEPVRAVSNFLELLVRSITKDRELNEKEQKYSNFIFDATKRMRCMIKDILTYSRLGSVGRIEDVDLNQILDEIKMNIETNISETSTVIKSEKLPIIKARKFEMVQLFQNLITNSIKFTPEGRNPLIEISFTENSEGFEFDFKDNGIGLKEEDYEKIFKVFQTVHNEYQKGTGVGLSICEKVISNYGGEVSVSSKYGEWTKFRFSLKNLVS